MVDYIRCLSRSDLEGVLTNEYAGDDAAYYSERNGGPLGTKGHLQYSASAP